MNKFLGLPIFAAAILLMVIPLSPLPIANAAGIIVPKDFPTIQDAIDAASDGDTILVLKGTYTEQLTIDKDLKIQGAGAKSTVINAPAVLNNNVNGIPYIVEVNNGAKVIIKGFTINGPATTDCGVAPTDGLIGVSVLDDATLKLDSTAIKGCTFAAVRVGAPFFFPNGPQVGHATITKTDITDYRFSGIVGAASGTTLTVSRSNIVGNAPDVPGLTGIVILFGAEGKIDNNKVSGNICNDPACGPDFFTQVQDSAILVEFDSTSAISNNELSNNDVGILVFSAGNECCKITHNKLKENRFFGIMFADGNYKSVHDKISGGNVGVAAVAISVDTTATLVHDKITDTTIPTQELECCGFTARIVTIPPNSFQSSQFSSAQATEVNPDPDFLKKKFGIEEFATTSSSSPSPF